MEFSDWPIGRLVGGDVDQRTRLAGNVDSAVSVPVLAVRPFKAGIGISMSGDHLNHQLISGRLVVHLLALHGHGAQGRSC